MGTQSSKDKDPNQDWKEISESSVEYILGHDGKRKLLGSGGAGSVYLAVHKHELVAVKKLHNPDLENERNEFISEMKLLAELDSPYIIRYLGGSLQDNILVTEFMQNGDLRYAIMTRNPMVLWENRGAAILLDIARGLEFLHSQRFIHRDLKSPNILLSSDFRAKLADVGIARGLAPGESKIDTINTKFSLRWASPENFTKADYTTLTDRSDIYGFGVIMWEIMAQAMPWDHVRWEYEIYKLVAEGQHNPIPDSCPPRCAALMKRCWALIPEERPTASEVVAELEDILSSIPPLEPVENLVLRFTGTSREGDPKLGPDGNLILKEGVLSLRSVWLQMWHIRYFTLTTRNIIYWTYQNNQKAREIRISLFKLRKTRLFRNTTNALGCMFEFVTFSRTYTLVAPSEVIAADWVAAIELAKGNTTSTRDTVMQDAVVHPNPKILESYQLSADDDQPTRNQSKLSTTSSSSQKTKPAHRPSKQYGSARFAFFSKRNKSKNRPVAPAVPEDPELTESATDVAISPSNTPASTLEFDEDQASDSPKRKPEPQSCIISRSAPQPMTIKEISRKPIHSQPEPMMPSVLEEIAVPKDERPPSLEDEECVTEIGIPDHVIGSLGPDSQGSMNVFERVRTGTMTSRDGKILTPCYYEADETDTHPPPKLLVLFGVTEYMQLFETVYDGFLELLEGRGFSLWSKLVDSNEEYEILESEFEDWRACISKVDRITVKSMSTPRLIKGDNDISKGLFRKSTRFSIPPTSYY